MIFFAIVLLLSSNLVCMIAVANVQCNDLLIHVENRTISRNTDTCTPSVYNNQDSNVQPAQRLNISCPNISSAFNYISSNVSNSVSCVHVTLSSNDHHIFTQPHNLSVSPILSSSNESMATIQCEYETSQKPVRNATDLLYTLFFLNVHFVKFEMVQFEGCKQPFRLEQVNNVAIITSYFIQFSDAVFDLYNCIHIIIDNSTFINNTGDGTVFLPLRGNTGAVSIGYHNNNNFENDTIPIVLISDSHFINNDATVRNNTFSTSTTAFLHNRFTGRGGSIALLMNLTVSDLNVNISGCQFKQNHAVSFGGAIYLLFTSKELHHMIIIEDSCFIDNVADNGAGAIQVTFNRAEVLSGQPMTAIIRNCTFIGNKAFIGGAVFLFPSLEGAEGNLLVIEDCYFYKNHADETGAGVSASQFAFFVPKDKLVNHRITNCTFVENTSPNGIVAINYVALEFTGTNNFSSNSGPAIRVIGALVDFHNTTIFERNTAMDLGGTLLIEAFGQLRVFPQTSFLFERNHGSIGSAIFVRSQTTSVVYTRLVHNPQCFLLYANQSVPLAHLHKEVNFTFYHNEAQLASSLFLSTTEPCSWIGNKVPYFNTTSILEWKFANTNGDKDVGNIDVRTTPTRMILPNNVTGWPGQRISVGMQAIDELNFSTAGIVELLPHNSTRTDINVFIAQNVRLVTPDEEELQLDYAIDRNYFINDNKPISINVQEVFTSVNGSILLNIVPCIAGYKLVEDDAQYSCRCNLDIEHILQCENDQSAILLNEGLWGSSYLSDPDDNLRAYRCPPGYCRCSRMTSFGSGECHSVYNNSDPNLQCTCDREGILCGNCKDGKGVSVLFNKCVDCNNAFGALIAALIIIDAIIIIVILLKEISLPAWLLPAIFNIQMISYVGEYYPVTYEKSGKYIYYIGSAIGLYFPYDFCLYSGTTALASYAYRYIPFWLSLIIFSSIFYYYYRKRQHRAKTYGLWALILLLYSHVVYTSMNVLNCPSINDFNGVYKSRWYFNATIQCFNEAGHIVLGIWAIIVLIFCLFLVPFVGIVSKRVLQRPYWLIHFKRVLRRPYKIQWWCVIELARRLIFLLSITAFPGNTSPPTLILMVIFSLYVYFMPYKELLANIMELIFQFVFLLLLLLRSTSDVIIHHHRFSDHVDSDACSVSEYDVTNLTLLLLPFAWLPVIGTILLIVFHLVNSTLHLQRFKEWLSSRRKADHLQTWFEQPGEPHYKTVFTEFVPNDTFSSWQFVVRNDEDDL